MLEGGFGGWVGELFVRGSASGSATTTTRASHGDTGDRRASAGNLWQSTSTMTSSTWQIFSSSRLFRTRSSRHFRTYSLPAIFSPPEREEADPGRSDDDDNDNDNDDEDRGGRLPFSAHR